MAERGTITIPAPVASVGERVEVMNYRRRGYPWEVGRVVLARYRLHVGGGWEYDVQLEERRYWLFVSDSGIRRIQPQPAQEPSR